MARGIVEPRQSVQRFAERMEITLRKNDHKGGWAEDSPAYFMGRIRDEFCELCAAYDNGTSEEIVGECVDLANFAMMLCEAVEGMG